MPYPLEIAYHGGLDFSSFNIEGMSLFETCILQQSSKNRELSSRSFLEFPRASDRERYSSEGG